MTKKKIYGYIGELEVSLFMEDFEDSGGDDQPPVGEHILFANPGLWLESTPGTPYRHENHVEVPTGNFKSINLSFDFVHGGWDVDSRPGYLHNLFWLVLRDNINMIGYVNAIHARSLRMKHGFGQRHIEKPKYEKQFNWVRGAKYHCDFVHVFGDYVEVTVTHVDSGEGKTIRLDSDAPGPLRLDSTKHFLRFHTGSDGEQDNEPVQLGWSWSDLYLTLTPAE